MSAPTLFGICVGLAIAALAYGSNRWLFSRSKPGLAKTIVEDHFTTSCELYTPDGDRGAAVLRHSDGSYFFAETERIGDAQFRWRQPLTPIGPYSSEAEAESAAVSRPWFLSEEAP